MRSSTWIEIFLEIDYLNIVFIYRYGFVHIGRVGSVLLTLSVTVERFFAIVYPLKRIRRTRFLIYSSVIGAIAYNVPRFFEFKTNYMQISEENKTLNVSRKLYQFFYFLRFIFHLKNLLTLTWINWNIWEMISCNPSREIYLTSNLFPQ